MSAIKLSTPSSGSISLSPADTSSNLTITVPAVTGTMLTNKTAGTVLQVVSATYNAGTVSTASTSYVTTNLTVSITPTSASNKILVMAVGAFRKGATNTFGPSLAIFRDSSVVYAGIYNELYGISGDASAIATLNYLDSPSSTSSIAYSLRFKSTNASNTQYFLPDAPNETGSIIVMEISG